MDDVVAETCQTYDLIAPEFARRNAATDAQLVERIDALATSLPRGGLVADVGCGPGREVTLFRQRGLRVIGVDLSFGQLRTSVIPGVTQADMRRLPLRTASVNGVWCQAALLHIPRRAVPEVLAEFARVLHTTGELHLSAAEGDGEGFEIASNYGSERRRWFTFHREHELTALLTAAGFAVYRTSRSHGHRNWLSFRARRLA